MYLEQLPRLHAEGKDIFASSATSGSTEPYQCSTVRGSSCLRPYLRLCFNVVMLVSPSLVWRGSLVLEHIPFLRESGRALDTARIARPRLLHGSGFGLRRSEV